MSAIPTGEILEAVNRGEVSLPALRRATGMDYPVLLVALEGPLAGAVRREETVDGFLRFYPLNTEPEHKVERIPVGPFCVQCRVECKMSHPPGTPFAGERRWICPLCKERFAGTHAKGGKMGRISDFSAADRRLNEIIAAGQKQPDDELCGCGKARGHKGICGQRESATKPKEPKPLCAECGKNETAGGKLCWECDATRVEAALAEIETEVPAVDAPETSPTGDAVIKIETQDAPDQPTGIVKDAPQRWCSVHKQNEPSDESLKHEIADARAFIIRSWQQGITIDGGLRMNISINIDPGEMVKWGALRISNFWEGLAKALRAVNGD